MDYGSGVRGDDEGTVVELARAGDRHAFNRLVLAYQDRIMTLCMRLLGNRAEAEEACQDTFVKAFRSLGSFKGDALFGTWVYRIAVNTCRNRRRSWWWRRLVRPARHGDNSGNSSDNDPVSQIPDSRLAPEKDELLASVRAAIQRALTKLPAIHREVIVLRDMDGRSYDEIAAILAVSPGTVKSRLARARQTMREELKGVCDGL